MSSRDDDKTSRNEKSLFVLHKQQEQTEDEKRQSETDTHRFHPTEEGLDTAEEVAGKLDIEMDREKTAKQSLVLLEDYYNDAAKALGDDICNGLTFSQFASRKLVAFSAQTKAGLSLVAFDQQLDSWLFSLNLLIGIRTFHILPEDKHEQTAALIQDVLATLEDPYLHEHVRPSIAPYIKDYAQTLPAVNAITMAMCAFIICHEIAHHSLGHVGTPSDPQQEFDADNMAYIYLNKMCSAYDQSSCLIVTGNMMATPCLLMSYFDMAEQYCARQRQKHQQQELPFVSITHPPSYKRRNALEGSFADSWTQEATNLHEGFSASLQELMTQLNIKPL